MSKGGSVSVSVRGRGEIQLDRELDTDVRGVFAADDVNHGMDKPVIAAAAEAALATFNYLDRQV